MRFGTWGGGLTVHCGGAVAFLGFELVLGAVDRGWGCEGSFPSSLSFSILRSRSRPAFICSLYNIRSVRFACKKNRVWYIFVSGCESKRIEGH